MCKDLEEVNIADMFRNAFLQWKPVGYLGSDDVSMHYNKNNNEDGKEEEEEEEEEEDENANLQERGNFLTKSTVVGNASVERLLPVMLVFGNVSLL